MLAAKYEHSGFYVGDKYWVAGGYNGSANTGDQFIYDFETNTWTHHDVRLESNQMTSYGIYFENAFYYFQQGYTIYKYALGPSVKEPNSLYIYRLANTHMVEIMTLKDFDRDLWYPELTFSSVQVTDANGLVNPSVVKYKGDGVTWRLI